MIFSIVETILVVADRLGSYAQFLNDWESVPGIPNLTIILSVWVCWEFWRNLESRKIQPIQALVSTFIVGFGGSSIASIMLAKPWGWLQGNINIPVYTFMALLVYYSPRNIVFNILERNRQYLVPIFTLVEAVSKAFTIARVGVDGVFNAANGKYADSISAAILIGTISGCGGGVTGSMIGLRKPSWGFEVPAQLLSPNKSMVLSFFCATIFIFTTRTHIFGRSSMWHWISSNAGSLGIVDSRVLHSLFAAPFLSDQQAIGIMTTMIWLCNNMAWLNDFISTSIIGSYTAISSRYSLLSAQSNFEPKILKPEYSLKDQDLRKSKKKRSAKSSVSRTRVTAANPVHK
jgi:hypothetical protein